MDVSRELLYLAKYAFFFMLLAGLFWNKIVLFARERKEGYERKRMRITAEIQKREEALAEARRQNERKRKVIEASMLHLIRWEQYCQEKEAERIFFEQSFAEQEKKNNALVIAYRKNRKRYAALQRGLMDVMSKQQDNEGVFYCFIEKKLQEQKEEDA